MVKITGVRFRPNCKIYYFSPGDLEIADGEMVIVETARGIECGEAVMGSKTVDEKETVSPLRAIIRKATPKDLKQIEINREKQKSAAKICEQKIAEHGLEMKLVDVECSFDNNKLIFYFTADSRVDFRELVKDLASVFRTRIELRQIGVRDEAKMLGGIGVCGRPFCCRTFLTEFQPVSIKMAKEQGLSLNPTKISGTCGRLMCCLKYEQDFYEVEYRNTPKPGAYVSTPQFKGYVEEANLITGKIRVHPERSDEPAQIFDKKDVKLIREAKNTTDREEMRSLKKLEDK